MTPARAITIGTFDSVHVGHAALLAAARKHVGPQGTVLVASFDPHPQSTLNPDASPARLTTFDQRCQLLVDHTADDIIKLEPTRQMLCRTPRQFVEYIIEHHAPTLFVEGDDFRFGAQRAGDINTLTQLGNELGFETISLPPVTVSTSDQLAVKASSSSIRWFLEQGRVRDAATMLARSYAVAGTVVQGRQMGRRIGFPTANLDNIQTMLPADGVYAGWATLPDASRLPAALSFGSNPTFPNAPRTAEAFILDWEGPTTGQPEYGWPLTLEIVAWIREQITFPSIHPLVNQIERDVQAVRTMLQQPTISWNSKLQDACT